jgi:hypothetical protein
VGLLRTKENEVEVKAYQALGAVRALRFLTRDLYSLASPKGILTNPHKGNH